jgi:uncharacterized membrane protein
MGFILFGIAWVLIGILQMYPAIMRQERVKNLWQGIVAFFLSIVLIVTWPVWSFPRKERK